jgi:hypothetical protein
MAPEHRATTTASRSAVPFTKRTSRMTIIAHFKAFGRPTLLGDLLLSTGVKPAREVHVPAARNINERIFLRQNFYIAGLTQKVVLMHKGLAIAWSGAFTRATDLFLSLYPLRNVEVNSDYVSAALNALDEPSKRELSWIALIANQSTTTLLTNGVEPLENYGQITEVTFSGSGSKQFRSIFPQLCKNIVKANPNASTDALREGFDATVLSAFAGEEFLGPIPLQEGWGGGLEVIRVVDGRMVRLRNQLSLNFFAEPGVSKRHWRL